MFEEVSKVFSRGFIIGYFLPGMLFILGNVLLFNVFFPQYVPNIQKSLDDFINIGYGPAFIVSSWILGIALLAVNRLLIRILEGYYILQYTPLIKCQQNRFDALVEEIKKVIETGYRKEELGESTEKTEQLFADLSLKRVSNFPINKDSLLATSFGNTIRAFEEYSYNVYGIDAIPVWPRIIALVPKKYRALISNAKSQVDSAVNVFYLTILLGMESIIAAIVARPNNFLWLIFPFICILVAILSYQLGISASRQWGETVKSVFDLYRYDLLKKIGVQPALNWQEERDQWKFLNRSFLYQDPLDDLERVIHITSQEDVNKGGKNA